MFSRFKLSNTILFDIHDMLMQYQLRVKSNTQAFLLMLVHSFFFISPLLVAIVTQLLFNLNFLKTDGFEINTNFVLVNL